MARLTLTIAQTTPDGVDVEDGAETVLLADGADFVNDGTVRLRVANASGGDITLTALTPITVGDGGAAALAVADRAVSVVDGTVRYFGPYPTGIFNQSNGKVYLDVSADGLSIAAFK